jgi:hypothetical protein
MLPQVLYSSFGLHVSGSMHPSSGARINCGAAIVMYKRICLLTCGYNMLGYIGNGCGRGYEISFTKLWVSLLVMSRPTVLLGFYAVAVSLSSRGYVPVVVGGKSSSSVLLPVVGVMLVRLVWCDVTQM